MSHATAWVGQLWDETPRRLAALGPRPRSLPARWATRTDTSGRTTQEAVAFWLGPTTQPLAECRLVRIRGATCSILNAWLIPCYAELPVFAAELVAFGGKLRLVFLDVQVPGLAASTVQRVRTQLAQHCRVPCPPTTEAPPDWATQASTGAYWFARAPQMPDAGVVVAAYVEYLTAYVELLPQLPPGPRSLAALAAYLCHHAEHSPGREFLQKWFGLDETDDFLRAFLLAVPHDNNINGEP